MSESQSVRRMTVTVMEVNAEEMRVLAYCSGFTGHLLGPTLRDIANNVGFQEDKLRSDLLDGLVKAGFLLYHNSQEGAAGPYEGRYRINRAEVIQLVTDLFFEERYVPYAVYILLK